MSADSHNFFDTIRQLTIRERINYGLIAFGLTTIISSGIGAGVIAYNADALALDEIPSITDVTKAREDIIQQTCDAPSTDPVLASACDIIERRSEKNVLAAKIRANEIADENGRMFTVWGLAAGAMAACLGVGLELRSIKKEYPN